MVHQIVPSGEQHQHDHQREADAKAELLVAFAERFAAHGFDGVEQQMPAVEHGNREKIDQAETDRQERHELNDRDQPVLGNLT